MLPLPPLLLLLVRCPRRAAALGSPTRFRRQSRRLDATRLHSTRTPLDSTRLHSTRHDLDTTPHPLHSNATVARRLTRAGEIVAAPGSPGPWQPWPPGSPGPWTRRFTRAGMMAAALACSPHALTSPGPWPPCPQHWDGCAAFTPHAATIHTSCGRVQPWPLAAPRCAPPSLLPVPIPASPPPCPCTSPPPPSALSVWSRIRHHSSRSDQAASATTRRSSLYLFSLALRVCSLLSASPLSPRRGRGT